MCKIERHGGHSPPGTGGSYRIGFWCLICFLSVFWGLIFGIANAAVVIVINDGPGRTIECTFSASKAGSMLDELQFKKGQTRVTINSKTPVCKVKGVCPTCPPPITKQRCRAQFPCPTCPDNSCKAPKVCAVPKVCPKCPEVQTCKAPKVCAVPKQCPPKYDTAKHMPIPRNCYYYPRWRPHRRAVYRPLLKCYTNPTGDYFTLTKGNKPRRKPLR